MIDALAFSFAGDKYLGTPYSVMDCQAFVERCMADCGYHRDLSGSNAWYRECIRAGWVGTPEECKSTFGSIPKGVILFILEPVSASTPAKYRNDGVGDATHMGIKTGRNEGAIHSSHKNQCVCTSKFKDKTIPNGGWNRVGMLLDFDYGKSINEILERYSSGKGSESEPDQKEETSMNMIVKCPEGETVFLRQSWNESSNLYGIWDRIKPGTRAEVIGTHGDKWKKVSINGKTGWMMSKFLVADDSVIPPEPQPDPDQKDDSVPFPDPDQGDDQEVVIKLSASEASTLFVLLGKINEQILAQVGRG